MAFHRDDRFANDGAGLSHGEIPIEPDGSQRGTGDEAAADAEESAENADEKSDYREIERADVGIRDREEHGLFGTAAEEAQEPGGDAIEQDGLDDDQDKRDGGVKLDVIKMQILEPTGEVVEDQEKIPGHKNGVEDQLDEKGP